MSCNHHNNRITPFWGFTRFSPTIPKLYWNVRSQEQRILRICEMLNRIVCYAEYLGDEVGDIKDDIERLAAEFEKFKESGFADYYLELFEKWIAENMTMIYERMAKTVFFGLTDDGYFTAYVPDSWSDIEFDTGYVYGQFDYGRLILRYDVDGSGVIDNTGRYDQSSEAMSQRLTSIEGRINRTEKTLYTPMSEGGDR